MVAVDYTLGANNGVAPLSEVTHAQDRDQFPSRDQFQRMSGVGNSLAYTPIRLDPKAGAATRKVVSVIVLSIHMGKQGYGRGCAYGGYRGCGWKNQLVVFRLKMDTQLLALPPFAAVSRVSPPGLEPGT
jgi:hypothetical protein